MARCKTCNGTGFNGDEDCTACDGTGYVDWWKTKEYRETGRVPKEQIDREKGFTEIGLVGGVAAGFFVYFYTQDSMTAVIVGVVITILAATLLKFIFKYFLVLFAIGYVVYLLFF